jgi:hypothetical protein
MSQNEPVLHFNKGVPKLRYSVRVNREIKHVSKEEFNRVLVLLPSQRLYLVTKGTCQTAKRLGRLNLTEYTGNWPVCALLWARLKELVRL